jgi:DNA-binding response OmpR family regulator
MMPPCPYCSSSDLTRWNNSLRYDTVKGCVPNSTSPMRVLVAEDDPVLAEVLTEFLEYEGHHVTRTSDVRHARNLVRDSVWDACILDPSGISAIELAADEAAELRHLAADVPVVVTTGGIWAERTPPADLGVCRILTKPYDLVELVQIINSMERQTGM